MSQSNGPAERDYLIQRLSLAELQMAASDLGYPDWEGQTKTALAQNLVVWLDHRNRLPDLDRWLADHNASSAQTAGTSTSRRGALIVVSILVVGVAALFLYLGPFNRRPATGGAAATLVTPPPSVAPRAPETLRLRLVLNRLDIVGISPYATPIKEGTAQGPADQLDQLVEQAYQPLRSAFGDVKTAELKARLAIDANGVVTTTPAGLKTVAYVLSNEAPPMPAGPPGALPNPVQQFPIQPVGPASFELPKPDPRDGRPQYIVVSAPGYLGATVNLPSGFTLPMNADVTLKPAPLPRVAINAPVDSSAPPTNRQDAALVGALKRVVSADLGLAQVLDPDSFRLEMNTLATRIAQFQNSPDMKQDFRNALNVGYRLDVEYSVVPTP
ncbi:MAG: hypothetical protein U0822_21465 [Anaerolineae bacterium]